MQSCGYLLKGRMRPISDRDYAVTAGRVKALCMPNPVEKPFRVSV